MSSCCPRRWGPAMITQRGKVDLFIVTGPLFQSKSICAFSGFMPHCVACLEDYNVKATYRCLCGPIIFCTSWVGAIGQQLNIRRD